MLVLLVARYKFQDMENDPLPGIGGLKFLKTQSSDTVVQNQCTEKSKLPSRQLECCGKWSIDRCI
jgi:hypothetical protein